MFSGHVMQIDPLWNCHRIGSRDRGRGGRDRKTLRLISHESVQLTASLFLRNVLPYFSMAITSQTTRNKGRHLGYMWSLEASTRNAVLCWPQNGGSVGSIKNVDHRKRRCFRWWSGSKGSPQRFSLFCLECVQPHDAKN